MKFSGVVDSTKYIGELLLSENSHISSNYRLLMSLEFLFLILSSFIHRFGYIPVVSRGILHVLAHHSFS